MPVQSTYKSGCSLAYNEAPQTKNPRFLDETLVADIIINFWQPLLCSTICDWVHTK